MRSTFERRSSTSETYLQTATLTIQPNPPYDLAHTAGHATHHRGRYGTDVFENGRYRRVLELSDRLVLFDVGWNGDVEEPLLNANIVSESLDDAIVAGAEEVLKWILGAEQDLNPFYRMAEDDAGLKGVMQKFYGLHIPRIATPYEALVSAILGQQVSSHVARILRALLVETYGSAMELDGERYYAFPRASTLAAAGVDAFRAIKFSRRKAEYVSGIAAAVESGELGAEAWLSMSDDAIVDTLCRIRGVGQWTAHWMLIQAFGRPDGFPHGDLALQRMVTHLASQSGWEPGKEVRMTAEETLEYSRRWSPYRSYVTTYLFAATRTGLI